VCGFMAWVEAKRFRRQSTAINATLENTPVYRLCTGQWGMQPPLLYLPRMVSMLVHVCLVLRSRLTQEASFVRCRYPNPFSSVTAALRSSAARADGLR